MKTFLYYPDFEPPDVQWLKFAILYLERFECIVPYSRIHLLSNEFNRLRDETDLVGLYSPTEEQGYNASLKSIEEVERIIHKPQQMSPLFNEANIIRQWKNPATRNYQIYLEKFSFNWARFCIENGIAEDTGDGLLVSEGLGFLFMAHLASEISFERGYSIITDNTRFDNYTNFNRYSQQSDQRRLKFAKGIINLLVPKDLSRIGIKQLIEFRNGNRILINAFNNQLDILDDHIGNGFTEREFIEDYNRVYSEIIKEIVTQGARITTIPLSLYILLQNPNTLTSEYVREIIGGIGIALGGTYAVKKAMFNSQDKRRCKKY